MVTRHIAALGEYIKEKEIENEWFGNWETEVLGGSNL